MARSAGAKDLEVVFLGDIFDLLGGFIQIYRRVEERGTP
jgi:hypothetical protein